MRVLLINPPHPAIGSRIPDDHLPPLGLLSIGGPLIDAGHCVRLIDADAGPMDLDGIVHAAAGFAPQAILLGHSGSTSGHPSACAVMRALRRSLPLVPIIYGGVYPTYHWREILAEEPQIDVVVRGEGEETAPRLLAALSAGGGLAAVPGIAYREAGLALATVDAPPVADLDACRVAWELVDLRRYSYWGGKRAVVVQFSRGCPHACSYCGQRIFWTRWRHRDPRRFAAELARLHRDHGVEAINFADENPTASRTAWRAFLEALVAERVPLILIGSTRADDIVRDADLLPLYKQAGVVRWLLGIESYDAAALERIGKGSATATDRDAIRLLRRHGILSMATWVVGFEDESPGDYVRGLRQLLAYDPDQIQLLHATPHRWTPFATAIAHRQVVQTDLSRWDYKHQVLASSRIAPWRVMLMVKCMEAIIQLRPRSLLRLLFHRDAGLRHGMRWYYRVGRRVWFHEIMGFLLRDRRTSSGPSLARFWNPLP